MPWQIKVLLAALVLTLLSVPAWAQLPIGGQVVSGGSGGTCSGDLSGTYPNCAVVNLSNTTNASLANSGLVNDSVTLNSHNLVLGGSLSLAFSDLTGTLTAAQMLALPNGDIYAGNGSNQPAATALGTGVLTALGNATGGTGGLVTFSGALGTPSSGTGTHLTGIPFTTGITGGASTGVGLFASGTPSIGTVPNSDLTNSATTVNGQTCTLGSTCTVTAVPSGAAGGDLGGSFPNPTVGNLSNVTNASLANSGLVNDSVTLNSHVLALGGSLTLGFSDFTGQIVAGQMMGLTNGSFYVGNGSNQPAVQAPGVGVLTAFELGVNTSGGLCTIGGSSSNCQMHVATLAQLQALTTAIVPNGVWRDDYAAGNGAPPLWFLPETGTCTANSRTNDGGSCVNTTSGDGNSFYAVFPNNILNVLQFGAKPTNGSPYNDSSTAITAALALCPGYTVTLPVVNGKALYQTTTGITVSNNCTLESQAGTLYAILGTFNQSTTTPLTLTGSWPTVKNLIVAGEGSAYTGNSLGATAGTQAILLSSGAVNPILENVYAQGGARGIADNGVDVNLSRVFVIGSYDACYYRDGGNVWSADHIELNCHSWNSFPAYGTTISAYALNTVYSANTVVSLAVGGRTYWIQTPNGGTSNNVAAPTPSFFGATFNDNNNGGSSTVHWINITTSAEQTLVIDTGAGETHMRNVDLDDAGLIGLNVNSTVSGFSAFFSDIVVAQQQTNDVQLGNGQDTHIIMSELFGPFGSSGSDSIIAEGGSWGGTADISHNLMSGGQFAVDDLGSGNMYSYNHIISSQVDGFVINGNNTNITNNRVATSGGHDIVTGAGLTQCIILGNNGAGSAATASYGDSCSSANKTPNQSW